MPGIGPSLVATLVRLDRTSGLHLGAAVGAGEDTSSAFLFALQAISKGHLTPSRKSIFLGTQVIYFQAVCKDWMKYILNYVIWLFYREFRNIILEDVANSVCA